LLEREMQKYRVSVELEIDEVPKVPVVANQIQQVLLNLLTNARQAMPTGGRLLIRLSHDAVARTVDLFVRDFGTGIPPEKLSKIFDPYFTTKSGPDETGKGGTGLGLSACRTIIQAHQGKIRVESTVGKGTAFTIKLPLVRMVNNDVPLAALALSRESLSTPAQT
ncbi:MAG: ATP-binding protein, partial [Pirellulaceae bacterium]